MKRVIVAGSRFGVNQVIKNWHGKPNHNYMVRLGGEDSIDTLSIQISGLHPYDDAEYAYARVESGQPTLANIIKDGRFLATVSMEYYDPEDWEDLNEYINEFVDRIIAKLEEVNKDVQPKIMHF